MCTRTRHSLHRVLSTGHWNGTYFPDEERGIAQRQEIVFLLDFKTTSHPLKLCKTDAAEQPVVNAPRAPACNSAAGTKGTLRSPPAHWLGADPGRTHSPEPEEGCSQGGQGLSELAGTHIGDAVLGQAAETQQAEGLRARLAISFPHQHPPHPTPDTHPHFSWGRAEKLSLPHRVARSS